MDNNSEADLYFGSQLGQGFLGTEDLYLSAWQIENYVLQGPL